MGDCGEPWPPLPSHQQQPLSHRRAAVVERLRQRIEQCRQHHLTCENRYELSWARQRERERRHSDALHARARRGSVPQSRAPLGGPAGAGVGTPLQGGAGAGGPGSGTEWSGGSGPAGSPASLSRNQRALALIALQEQLKRRLEESDYGDRANGSSYDCAPPGPKRARGDSGGSGGPHGAHAGAPLSAPLRHPLPPHPQHARQHGAPLPAPSHGRCGGGGGVQHCGTAVSVTHCVTGDRSRKTIHTTVTVLQDGGAGTALKVEPRDGVFCSVDDDLKRGAGGAPGCGVSSEVDQELEFILEELERELAKGDTKEAFDFGRPALNGDDERPAAVEEEEHKHFLKLERCAGPAEHGAARRCEDKVAAALGTLVVKREMSPSCHGSAGAGSPLHAQGRTAPSPVVASPPSQQQPVQAARFPPQTAPPAHHHAHHNHIQQQHQQHQQLGMNMSFTSRLQAPMNYQGVPPFQQQAVARHVQQQQQQQGVKGQLPVQGGPSCGWPPSAPARGGPRSSPAYDADRPKVSASGHAMAPSRPGPTSHVAQPGRASPSPAGHAAQPNHTPPGAASQANHNHHHRHHHQLPQQHAQHQQQQHHLPVALPGQMPAPRGAEGVVSPGCGHPPGPPVPVNAAAGAATPPSQGGHTAPLGHKGSSAAAITRPHEACPNVTAGALSYGDTKPLTHFDPDGEEARGVAAAAAGGGPPPAMPGAVAAPGSGGFYPHDAGARQPARARTAPEVRRLLLRRVLEQGGLGGGELAARIGAQYQPGAQEKVVGGLNLKPSPGPGFPGNRLAATLPGLNATEQKRELIHQQLMENQQLHRHLTRPPPEYKDQPMAVPANSYPVTTQPFSMPIGSPVTQMSPVHCPGASQPPPPVYALPNGSPLHHHHQQQQQQQPSMMGIVPPPSPVVVATQQGTNMSGHGVRAVRSSVTPGAPVPVPVPVPVPGRLVHPAEPAAFRGQRAAAGHNVWGQQNQQGQQHPQQIQQQRFPLPNQAVNFPVRPSPAHLSTAPQAGLGQLNPAPGTPGQVPSFPPLHGEQGGGGGFFRVSGGCSNVAVESMGGAAGSGLASLNGGSDFVDSLLKGSGGGGGGSGSGGSNEDWQDLEEILGQN